MESRPLRARLVVMALVNLACAVSGCGGGPGEEAPAGAPADASGAATAPGTGTSPAATPPDDEPPPPPPYEAGLPEGVRSVLSAGFTGDLDQMVERRLIRVGVTYNRSFYFVDRGVQRGASYEMGLAFEEQLNKKLKTRPATKIHVVFLPLPRDMLGAALIEGRID